MGEGKFSTKISAALPEGTDFIWNREWKIPCLRVLSKSYGDLGGEQLRRGR